MIKKIIIRSLSFFLFILTILSLFSGCRERQAGTTNTPVTLVIYGLDNSDAISPIIAAYKKRKPTVTVRYKKFDNKNDYENLLVNEIAEGEGPDVMYIHNSWLPRHGKKLVPLTSDSLTTETYGTAFVNVVEEDFIQPDPKDGLKKIYALPLFVDTLALYYNEDHFEKAIPSRGKPPATWEEMKQDSVLLREQNADDSLLKRGSIALGRSDTISLASDILINFLLQGGVDFYDVDYKQSSFAQKGQTVFDLFLGFANKRSREFGWSTELSNLNLKTIKPEVDAFVSGKVSSIIAYADLYPRLENEIKNAKSRGSNVIALSDIKVASLPQISSDETMHKVLANYYGLAVSRTSKHPDIAWDFIQFVASKDMSKQYITTTKLPAARRDLLEEQKKDPILAPFVNQIGSAVSIKQYSESRYREYLNEAINNAVKGMSSRTALNDAQAKINELLRREAPQGLYPKPLVIKKK